MFQVHRQWPSRVGSLDTTPPVVCVCVWCVCVVCGWCVCGVNCWCVVCGCVVVGFVCEVWCGVNSVNLSTCQFVNLSICQFVNLSIRHLSSLDFFNLLNHTILICHFSQFVKFSISQFFNFPIFNIPRFEKSKFQNITNTKLE